MQIIIPIILIILILDVNAVIIQKMKSAAEPAILFSVLFGAQMTLSLLFLYADIKGIYFGFFWILAGVSTFALGSYLTKWLQRNNSLTGCRADIFNDAKDYTVYDSRIMIIILALMLMLSFVQPVSMLYRLGYNMGDLFTLHTLLAINSTAAHDRYVIHDFATSASTQIFLVLV
jgi:hypothetical protein